MCYRELWFYQGEIREPKTQDSKNDTHTNTAQTAKMHTHMTDKNRSPATLYKEDFKRQ